jgi:ABC-type transport system involved in multi-copper enzyme maturation permease subunit
MSSISMAVLRRDYEIEKTYRLRLLLIGLNTIFVAVGLFFFGRLVTDPSQLGNYSGGYFAFALVGLAVTTFAGVGLQSFSASLVAEQSTGTVDLLLSSPAPKGGLLFGLFLMPFGLAAIEFVVLLGLGIISEPLRLLQTELGLVISLTQIEMPLMLLLLQVLLNSIQPQGESNWRSLKQLRS